MTIKNFFKSKLKNISILFIFLLGVAFRVYGVNWDQNQHLHPDERFLTMATEAINRPNSITEYFDPRISSFNPYNVNYKFFVYGTLPMYLTKIACEFIKIDPYDYHNITLVGRLLSAVFDLGTLVLVFSITKKITKISQGQIPLLATLFYAISVLPIQLSHFYAVDTFLVFFLLLCFYLLVGYQIAPITKSKIFSIIFGGIAFGFALACKISAILFLPIIFLNLVYFALKQENNYKQKFFLFIIFFLLFTIFSYLGLRLADPRVFANSNFLDLTINSQFVNNLKELKSFSDPRSGFPPSIQWLKTKPIIFPLKNLLLWGLGLPLGILALGGIFHFLWQSFFIIKKCFQNFNYLTHSRFSFLLILFWIIFLFSYQSFQLAKPMRYFFPIYPFLAILTANFLNQISNLLKKKIKKHSLFILYCPLLVLSIGWPISFISIYSQPHSRVSASKWIYENIPPGSIISCEHWDDCLPLEINGKSGSLFQVETLNLYDPDNLEKWQRINQQLERIDYLILSSNRLWGSIPKVPERYPISAKFYQDLFAEKLNFTKIAEITSYPHLQLGHWRIEFNDSSADESFTVYDHPKVMIFKRVILPDVSPQ